MIVGPTAVYLIMFPLMQWLTNLYPPLKGHILLLPIPKMNIAQILLRRLPLSLGTEVRGSAWLVLILNLRQCLTMLQLMQKGHSLLRLYLREEIRRILLRCIRPLIFGMMV